MSWDKMDRNAWNDSEVMKELEKKIAESAVNLASQFEKAAQSFKDLPSDLAKVNQEAKPAAESMKQVADAAEKLYSSADDPETPQLDEEEVEETLESIENKVEELIDELTKISHHFADLGDTSLAYKLERVIKDIEAGKDED